MTNLQLTVALCAGAGFLIVWLVFPSKNARVASAREGEGASPGASSSEPPPEDEPHFEQADEGSQKEESTYRGYRPRWCDILLLEPDASPAAVRKAYARLMKGLHPDVAGADQHTTRQCALVQEAYQQAMQDRRARA
jgi:hypothetical protein